MKCLLEPVKEPGLVLSSYGQASPKYEAIKKASFKAQAERPGNSGPEANIQLDHR